jgi:hypothetical protein
MADLRMRSTQKQAPTCDRQNEVLKIFLKKISLGETSPGNERPVRGDNRTGQAIWALGWMGARAGYSLVGEGLPSHISWSWAVDETFKPPANFSNVLAGLFSDKLSHSGGMIGIAGG